MSYHAGAVRREEMRRGNYQKISLLCCTWLMALMFAITWDVPSVAASSLPAASSATTIRQDRRPDRERPTSTSQASNPSSSPDASTSKSRTTSSTKLRPRLVRR